MTDAMKPKPVERSRADGTVPQANHAKCDFDFKETEDKTSLIFRLAVPRFMQTNDLNVEVEPTYVRCLVKDKVVQLCWPDEVLCDRATIQRSTTTGELVITAPKSNVSDIEARNMRIATIKENSSKRRALAELKETQLEAKEAEISKMENVAKEGAKKNEYLEIGENAKSRPVHE